MESVDNSFRSKPTSVMFVIHQRSEFRMIHVKSKVAKILKNPSMYYNIIIRHLHDAFGQNWKQQIPYSNIELVSKFE